MEIIKYLNSEKSLIKCSKCGHVREVTTKNFKNGFGKTCSFVTCGEDHVKTLFKDKNYDYEFVALSKNKVVVKCTICNSVKETAPSKIRRGRGMHHNGSNCINYRDELIGKNINDFTILEVIAHPKYAGIKLVKIQCKKCNRIRFVRDKNLHTYNHSKCVDLIDIPKRLYNIWCSIKSRCKINDYYKGKDYSEFENFIDFYDLQYSKYLESSKLYGEKNISIDRINNELGYSDDNVRWVTPNIQLGNTRKSKITHVISPQGVHYKFSNIVVFSKLMNLNRGSVNNAICGSGKLQGWEFDRTNIYNNTKEGVETNCVYKLHESVWMKLPNA